MSPSSSLSSLFLVLGCSSPHRLRFACVSALVSPMFCLRLASFFHQFVAYLMTCFFHRNFLLHLACTPNHGFHHAPFATTPGLHQAAVTRNHGLHQSTIYTTHCGIQRPLLGFRSLCVCVYIYIVCSMPLTTSRFQTLLAFVTKPWPQVRRNGIK